MKHLSMLLCAAVLAVAAPVHQARAEVDVSIDFFYDALTPHGDWIYADDYGYVWQPTVASQPDWAPYSDGYWAYTDAGWTWISNEDFGWATYHYGRWIRMHSRWVWVPGNEWAPAWVSWRQSDDYVGWAPLPPEASWSVNVGFNQWTDSYYDIGPSYYNFVPVNAFARRTSLRPVIIDRSRNVTYVDRSVNITNISYRQNVVNNIFVGGPDPDRIDRIGDSRIRRLALRRDDDNFRREWLDNDRRDRPRGFGSLSRIDQDALIVAAPGIRADGGTRLPPRVRERFDRPEIDRGWRNVENRELADRLRERNREILAKDRPATLPEKAIQLITGKEPPPAIGRDLKPEERRQGPGRPDASRIEDDVRRVDPNRPDRRPGSPRDEPPTADENRRPGQPMSDRDGRPGLPGREQRPGERPDGDRRPDMGIPERDRDLHPGERPGPDRDRDGRPGAGRESRPGMDRDRTSRPGVPDRGNRPDLPGRDGRPDADRPGMPDSNSRPGLPGHEDSDRPGIRRDGRPDRTPEARPGDRNRLPEGLTPDPRRTPGNASGAEGNRRRDGAPGRPGAEAPSESRSDTIPTPRNARPAPMPEPKAEPKARSAPMPKPDAPEVKPVPMPKPEAKPTPAAKRPEVSRREAPEIRVAKPQVKAPAGRPQVQAKPKVQAPQSRPVKAERPSLPQPKPQVRQAPPKPQAAPKAAAPKPQKAPGKAPAAKKPGGKKND